MPRPQIPEPGLKYRPEIDGLRAIAVLGVLAEHFRVPGFQGGFIGVDIFFVISGFLITRMISTEIAERRYSIWTFYERRARRILPALFFMLIIATAAAMVLLFPGDLRVYSRTLLGTLLFISNIEFWRITQDYFQAQRETQPLLHTWSLGVEEQFYLFFPLILMAIARLRQNARTGIIVALTLVSFGVSCWLTKQSQASAFYLLPSRFWELACGSILSELRPATRSRRVADLLSVAGFGAIAIGTVLFVPGKTPFPGLWALLPCLGTVALIVGASNEGCFAKRLLSARPVVFVGLISYSLYLWHWPLLTYLRFVRPEGPTALDLSIAAAASLIMATVSWRWIERPFRGASNISVKALAAGALSCAAVLTLGIIKAYDGFPGRYDDRVKAILAAEVEPYNSTCFDKLPETKSCTIGASTKAAPSFLLWGDSHADAIMPAVEAAAMQKSRAGAVVLNHECPPFLGDMSPITECAKADTAALHMLADKKLNTVILVGNWPAQSPVSARYLYRLRQGISDLEARGKQVILVADVPNEPDSVPDRLAKQLLFDAPPIKWLSRSDYEKQQSFLLVPAQRWTGQQFSILQLAPALCPQAVCLVQVDGRPLYRDSDHLSRFGASLLVSQFSAVL